MLPPWQLQRQQPNPPSDSRAPCPTFTARLISKDWPSPGAGRGGNTTSHGHGHGHSHQPPATTRVSHTALPSSALWPLQGSFATMLPSHAARLGPVQTAVMATVFLEIARHRSCMVQVNPTLVAPLLALIALIHRLHFAFSLAHALPSLRTKSGPRHLCRPNSLPSPSASNPCSHSKRNRRNRLTHRHTGHGHVSHTSEPRTRAKLLTIEPCPAESMLRCSTGSECHVSADIPRANLAYNLTRFCTPLCR